MLKFPRKEKEQKEKEMEGKGKKEKKEGEKEFYLEGKNFIESGGQQGTITPNRNKSDTTPTLK